MSLVTDFQEGDKYGELAYSIEITLNGTAQLTSLVSVNNKMGGKSPCRTCGIK